MKRLQAEICGEPESKFKSKPYYRNLTTVANTLCDLIALLASNQLFIYMSQIHFALSMPVRVYLLQRSASLIKGILTGER